jgi:hypothetical protein
MTLSAWLRELALRSPAVEQVQDITARVGVHVLELTALASQAERLEAALREAIDYTRAETVSELARRDRWEAALAAEGWTLVDAHNALNRVDEQVTVLADRIAAEARREERAAIAERVRDFAPAGLLPVLTAIGERERTFDDIPMHWPVGGEDDEDELAYRHDKETP